MSMNTKTIRASTAWVALGALVVTGALLWMPSDRPVVPPSVTASMKETLATESAQDDRLPRAPQIEDAEAGKQELDRALTNVNQKLAAMREQIAQLQHAQVSPPAREQAAAADPLERQEAARRAEAQLRAQEALIEETVRREQADPAWAPIATASIVDVFQNKEVKDLRLLDVQCRTTLCRIETAAAEGEMDGTPFDQSFRKLVLHAPWQGEGFGRIAPPDSPSPTAVFFLAREGHALPQPPS